MRDHLCCLRLGKSVIHRPVDMVGNLRDLTASNQGADSHHTPIPRSQVRTQPKIPEQNIGGVLHDAGTVRMRRDTGAQKVGFASRPFILCGLPVKKPGTGNIAPRTAQRSIPATGDWHPSYAWDWRTLNFDTDLALADKTDNGTINATDPDLKGFVGHGGKLLLYHGWNDQLIAAQRHELL